MGSVTVCQLEPSHCWTLAVDVGASTVTALTQKTDETQETGPSYDAGADR